MNSDEAAQVLEAELELFERESYAELARRIGADSVECQRTGASGATYQVQLKFFWDDRPGGDIRVLGLIDNGGWRAFVPLTRDFIKSADGSPTPSS